MKILIVQEKGRHFKNQEFREALNFKRALSKLNIESEVWGLNYDTFKVPFDDFSKNFDSILLLENYETNGWLPNMENKKQLKLFWSIDSHFALGNHVATVKKNKINIVLGAIESDLSSFRCDYKYYFPNAYPDDLIYYKEEIEKSYDIGFCGGPGGERINWVNSLEKDLNLKKDIFVIGDDMVNAINSYKIHFNRNLANDINYRTFETLAVKTLLITNLTENLDKLFNIKKDLVIYDNYIDLVEKIKYYIEKKEERNQIIENGFANVKNNHTYLNRAKTLLEIIKEKI